MSGSEEESFVSDVEEQEEAAEVETPKVQAPAPMATSQASSGGSAAPIIGLVLAAGAALAGGVAYKLLSKPKAPKASPTKKTVSASPGKKTVPRRIPSSPAARSPAADASGSASVGTSSASAAPAAAAAAAGAAAVGTATAAAAAAAPAATQRSGGPSLPARPSPKRAVRQPEEQAAAAAAAASAAAERAASEAAAAQQKAEAEAAAAAAAAKQRAEAEAAAAKQRAEAEAAAEKERAAAQKRAAEEAAAKEKAAAAAAAASAAASAAAVAASQAKEAPAAAPPAPQPATPAAAAPLAAAAPAESPAVPLSIAAPAEKLKIAAPEERRAIAAPPAEAPAAAAAAEAPAAAPAPAQPAAQEDAAAEPQAEQEAGVEAEGEQQEMHHVMPTSADVAALVLPLPDGAASAADGQDEGPPAALERLADIPTPAMSFEGAPDADADLNEVEKKAKEMSLHAHKVVKEKNNVIQGAKEQKAALDLLLLPENAGRARPTLVAACAFALGDMMLAQRKVEETKEALAIAYQASSHIPDNGPKVRALMNYAYILKSERKAAATEATYKEALELARAQHGARHGMVEKIKYEWTALLGGTGREAEAANMLIQSAAELLGEAEKLEAEGANGTTDGDAESAQAGRVEGKAAAEANGTAVPAASKQDVAAGLEGEVVPEGDEAGAAGQEDEEEMSPVQAARHFAMRNLMNAAGVLDSMQQYERGEELLARALDIAVVGWGRMSMQHLNVVYALAQHFRRRNMLEESIAYHEQVLTIMDESIEVYSPELLQHRIAILRDAAVLMDKTGQGEMAVEYATGAMVNAQTLAGIMIGQQRTTVHPILEPFYELLASLKAKIGDEEGAAEARRMLNENRLHARLAQQRGSQQQQQRKAAAGKVGGAKRASSSGASTQRAGGRRV